MTVAFANDSRARQLSISAIIPTLNEEAAITRCVASCSAVADETIVADGGSADETCRLAQAAGARVVRSEKGRGAQLNAGATLARGSVLLFVHADAHVPAEAREVVRRATEAGHAGGNFKLRFVPETLIGNVYATGNHLRRRFLGIYYGDSCIFVQRAAFDRLGGFADLPLFEDYEFVRRLERVATTHYETRVVVSASSRRFAERPLQTLALWTSLQTLYAMGVSATRLAGLYAQVR
jgi:rSAM/selenodomain-associated transferase 2